MKNLLMLLFTMIAFASCEVQPDSNKVAAAQQEQLAQESNRQVGMPGIVNFQEKKLMKQIIELRDQENLICYAYIVPEMTGKPVLLGKCIGYGLPYATQYTNPMKTVYKSQYGIEQLPQADPNGLFMPNSAEGTWVMLIDSSTSKARPVYVESRVLISPFPLN